MISIQLQTRVPLVVRNDDMFKRYEKILNKRNIDLKFDKSIDREDFLERAAKIVAYHDTCIEMNEILFGYEKGLIYQLTGNSIEIPDILYMDAKKPFGEIMVFGSSVEYVGSNGPMLKPLGCEIKDLAPVFVDYYKSEVFMRNALRKCVIARNTEEEDEISEEARKYPPIREALKKMGNEVAIKIVGGRGKEMPLEIFKNKGMIPEDIYWFLYRNYRLLSMLQDKIIMKKEYRFIVIDGEMICGAGCVPELTPGDNEEIFDEKIRNENGVGWYRDKKYVEKIKEYAIDIIKQLNREGIVGESYTLDVFENENGEIGIVEMNPIALAGLYAGDVEKFAKKMVLLKQKNNYSFEKRKI